MVLKQLNTVFKILLQSLTIQTNSLMLLHNGAIAAMIKKGKGTNQNYAVWCSKVRKHGSQAYVINIFDGEQNRKGIVEVQSTKKSLDRYVGSKESFRIVITSFTIYTAENKRKSQSAIVIEGFQFAQVEPVKEEQCQPSSPKVEHTTKNVKKQHKRIESIIKPIKMEPLEHTIPKSSDRRKQKLKLLFSEEQNQETAAQVAPDIDISNFQNISDLYPNLYAWQILVRVIDKSYRDFLSKQNRSIQMLNIDCIDRNSTMIEATGFGEQATHLNNVIEVGGVYRIARCRIVEEEYNRRKGGKYAKYNLKIGSDSSILAVHDFPEIPYDSNNYSRLSQITESMDMSQLYSFVGILSKIDVERTILKLDKEIIMQSFTIYDPTIDRAIEGLIWNRQVKLDKDLQNKSVVVKNVKVSKYKDSIILNTTFKSQLIVHNMFDDHQEIYNLKTSLGHYSHKNIKKLADLSIELTLIDKEPIVSEIYVWVKSIMFGSKWYYQSCPKCKKTAIPCTTCINCSHYVEECIKRFLLTIELCDDTGSIYVTAFEDTASIFLRNATMEDLLMMEQDERKAYGDGCTYESYWLKISCKKDVNGRINHQIMGRPQVSDSMMQCRMNLSVIRRQLEHLRIIKISS